MEERGEGEVKQGFKEEEGVQWQKMEEKGRELLPLGEWDLRHGGRRWMPMTERSGKLATGTVEIHW